MSKSRLFILELLLTLGFLACSKKSDDTVTKINDPSSTTPINYKNYNGIPAINNYTVIIQATSNNITGNIENNQAIITNVYITYYDEKRIRKTEVLTPNQPSFKGNYRALNYPDFKVLAQARIVPTKINQKPQHNQLPIIVQQPISIAITILRDGVLVKYETEHSLTGFVSEDADTDGDIDVDYD